MRTTKPEKNTQTKYFEIEIWYVKKQASWQVRFRGSGFRV